MKKIITSMAVLVLLCAMGISLCRDRSGITRPMSAEIRAYDRRDVMGPDQYDWKTPQGEIVKGEDYYSYRNAHPYVELDMIDVHAF
jgi:hypothetical protein